MRILFVSSPGLGHINPMLPLATALRGRGHDVRWAVGRGYLPAVADAGFEATEVGYSEAERWAEVRRALGIGDGTGAPPGFGGPGAFALLFGRVLAPRVAADLEPLVEAWQPALVVHDMSELASAPLATSRGLPHVTFSWAGVLPAEAYAGAAEATARLWTDRGLEPRTDAGVFQHLFLYQYPPSLTAGPRPGGRLQPIRPPRILPAAGASLPDWLDGLGTDAVYVTLGTLFNEAAPMRSLLAAVAGLGRPVVGTLGPGVEVDDVGDVPATVHIATYIPQDALLPHCALVVSHAGAGTFLGAAAAGVPQLCLPLGADQWLNGAAAERSGIGVTLPADRRAPDDIRSAATTLLGTPDYGMRAREIAGEISRMPAAESVAAVVEELAGSVAPAS